MAIATFFLAPSLKTTEFTGELGKNNPQYTLYLFTPESTLSEGVTRSDKTITLKGDIEIPIYGEIPTFSDELPGALAGATPAALKGYNALDPDGFQELQTADLANVSTPYLVVAAYGYRTFTKFEKQTA